MPSVLKAINAAIIPLRKLDLFKGAIPSKIFENLAMEIPILLGVDGEARELFINKGNCGIYFAPGDVHDLTSAITKITINREMAVEMGRNGRRFVDANFNREVIAKGLYERLQKL
jgi:glycosyltransferase involved in cell wall biosynthesis